MVLGDGKGLGGRVNKKVLKKEEMQEVLLRFHRRLGGGWDWLRTNTEPKSTPSTRLPQPNCPQLHIGHGD